jgi:hypothetical protein
MLKMTGDEELESGLEIGSENLRSGLEWAVISGKTNPLIAWRPEDVFGREENWSAIADAAITGWAKGPGWDIFGLQGEGAEGTIDQYFDSKLLLKLINTDLVKANGQIDCLVYFPEGQGGTFIYGWLPSEVSRSDRRPSLNYLVASFKRDTCDWLLEKAGDNPLYPGETLLPALYPSCLQPISENAVLEALRKFGSWRIQIHSSVGLLRIEDYLKGTLSERGVGVKADRLDFREIMKEVYGDLLKESGFSKEDRFGIIREVAGLNKTVTLGEIDQIAEELFEITSGALVKAILRQPEVFIKRAQEVSVHTRALPQSSLLFLRLGSADDLESGQTLEVARNVLEQSSSPLVQVHLKSS